MYLSFCIGYRCTCRIGQKEFARRLGIMRIENFNLNEETWIINADDTMFIENNYLHDCAEYLLCERNWKDGFSMYAACVNQSCEYFRLY